MPWRKISEGLAALLLGAASVALLIFAGALFLGLLAVTLIAAAGLFLAAPEASRKTIEVLIGRIDTWVAAMKGIVEEAGALLTGLLGAKAQQETAAPQGEQTPGENAAPAAEEPLPSETPSDTAPQNGEQTQKASN
ncbi:hypothetical protein [Sutterella sp.]|uniref:hypothetical protein n=1 Tax=Sutterella sp. TaxID=1981025 RepID=UPI0026E0B633|nr:hypothetical protein [Sutterella sp.]MDO5532720.1 hypothetical protein [Sutterella sp.]